VQLNLMLAQVCKPPLSGFLSYFCSILELMRLTHTPRKNSRIWLQMSSQTCFERERKCQCRWLLSRLSGISLTPEHLSSACSRGEVPRCSGFSLVQTLISKATAVSDTSKRRVISISKIYFICLQTTNTNFEQFNTI